MLEGEEWVIASTISDHEVMESEPFYQKVSLRLHATPVLRFLPTIEQ